jgi:hypothetical protein
MFLQKGVILMNRLKRQLICLAALVNAAHLFGDGTTSMIVPRSQSFNAARQIVGWDNTDWGINRKPQDKYYSSFNIIFEYTRTFRDNRLARALFGNDLTCTGCDDASITISGSAVTTRNNQTDWLADYFGLSTDFQSTVTFKPQISNYILDFSYYAGLDAWVDGMYFKIYGPFVHTKWNLNAQECNITPGTNGFFQGYFSSNTVPAANLNTSFLSYANGCTPYINNDYSSYGEEYCTTTGANGSCTTPGNITWNSLCCSKISPECGCDGQGLSRNGFGELRFVLGYNFLNDEAGDYHLGLGAYVAAPTGTRVGDEDCGNTSKGRYLFQPIVGNGKHWEVGGQVTAHQVWWRSEDEEKDLTMYIEANVTHLFSACQTRCFDLCSAGSNSRYMLAELLQSNRNSNPGLNATTFNGGPFANSTDTILSADTLGLEFGNAYAPVANITRRNVSSTIGAQGDVAFSLAYRSGNFQWDVGYDFWGRTCEKLNIKGDCCSGIEGQWALKGDQRVYGFVNSPATAPTSSLAMKIPATDSQANIHAGSNLLSNQVSYATATPTQPKNFYADNSMSLAATGTANTKSITTYPEGTVTIYTSEQPVIIQESDFDLAGTRGISNKFFTHFNYAWPQMKDSKWTPYVGIGFEAECGGGNKRCNDDCNTSCNTGCTTTCNPCTSYPTPSCTKTECSTLQSCCTNAALSQWGVWFKLGTSYN